MLLPPTKRNSGHLATYGVKVLDAVTCLLVAAERGLVLFSIKLGLGIVGGLDGRLALELVDVVDVVRDGLELRGGVLDVVGDFRCVNHCDCDVIVVMMEKSDSQLSLLISSMPVVRTTSVKLRISGNASVVDVFLFSLLIARPQFSHSQEFFSTFLGSRTVDAHEISNLCCEFSTPTPIRRRCSNGENRPISASAWQVQASACGARGLQIPHITNVRRRSAACVNNMVVCLKIAPWRWRRQRSSVMLVWRNWGVDPDSP